MYRYFMVEEINSKQFVKSYEDVMFKFIKNAGTEWFSSSIFNSTGVLFSNVKIFFVIDIFIFSMAITFVKKSRMVYSFSYKTLFSFLFIPITYSGFFLPPTLIPFFDLT